MHSIFVVLALVALVGACPKTTPVRCPAVTVVSEFKLAEYLGTWYEIERSPQPFAPNGACVTAQYTLQEDLTYPVAVFNRQFNEQTGVYDSLLGGARKADVSGDGKLKVIFPVTPSEADYWVLDTDYVSFAIVYSCRQLPGGGLFQSAWVLGRSSQLSTATKRLVDASFAATRVDRDLLSVTRHDETCIYGSVTPHDA